ncbi:MAG: GNAT family N-acetyltransferase, partial [Pseudomonadota bacterium]
MLPGPERLLAAVDATWPPAEMVERNGWVLRRGAGGGKRVSAASRLPGAEPDVTAAVAGLAAWAQPPLFRLDPGDGA